MHIATLRQSNELFYSELVFIKPDFPKTRENSIFVKNPIFSLGFVFSDPRNSPTSGRSFFDFVDIQNVSTFFKRKLQF